MKKKLLVAFLIVTMLFTFTACGIGGSDSSSSSKKEETKKEEKKEKKEKPKKEEKKDPVLQIGETWEVDGMWKVTVNSVTPTDDRNEFSDLDPAAVYVINYTYENLGYEDSIMDGLYISFEMGQIVDSQGSMGFGYPAGEISLYPQAIPVGANHTAEEAIGLLNDGPFSIILNEYDSKDNTHKAKFEFAVE